MSILLITDTQLGMAKKNLYSKMWNPKISKWIEGFEPSEKELINLNKEVFRMIKPGGYNIFTVRNTLDGDYKNGNHIIEDIYENDGFLVHFFSDEKVQYISKSYYLENIEKFEEGKFPRKLSMVTLKR